MWYWRRLLRVPWKLSKRSNQSILKGINPNIHWKDCCCCCWGWSSNTLATWCEVLTHWQIPWCWERLRKRGKGRTDDEMAGWTWVWANSGRWWRTGKPVVVQSMGLQSVGCDLATQQQQSLCYSRKLCPVPVLLSFVVQSCPTLCNPMGCSMSGSTVLCVIVDSIIGELGNQAKTSHLPACPSTKWAYMGYFQQV